MKILIHGINFHPEPIGVGKYTGELADWLTTRGHQVRVVTAPPHYPRWRTGAPYCSWKYSRERRMPAYQPGNGAAESPASTPTLDVFRCPLWLPKGAYGWRRILCLISFALSSAPVMLRQAIWRPDVVLIVVPTLFCSLNALVVARLSGAKALLHVQDFEVDAAFAIGQIVSGGLEPLAQIVERILLQRFDCVSTISEKMRDRLVQKGVSPRRCGLLPNWVDTQRIFPLRGASPLRQELRISSEKIVALYSGNMARKQGLGLLLDASHQLALTRPDVHFVFCGEGPSREQLIDATADASNVSVLPLQPLERLNDLLNLADIHLLPQCADAADLVMPSKLTGMLASGRPIVTTAAAETQLARSLQGKGLVTPPGKTTPFCEAIARFADDAGLRQKLGAAGRAYAVAYLDREVVLTHFEASLIALCRDAMRKNQRSAFDVSLDPPAMRPEQK
jgi:colanic acid biosynthesis glycosyl transferase WcaI